MILQAVERECRAWSLDDFGHDVEPAAGGFEVEDVLNQREFGIPAEIDHDAGVGGKVRLPAGHEYEFDRLRRLGAVIDRDHRTVAD